MCVKIGDYYDSDSFKLCLQTAIFKSPNSRHNTYMTTCSPKKTLPKIFGELNDTVAIKCTD